MSNILLQATGGICTLSQAATAAVLDGPQAYLAERSAIYRERRDLVVARLDAIPGITCHRPEGAFYVFPNVAGCLGRTSAGGRKLDTDTDFVTALLAEAHVAAVPGSAYGMSPHVRLSYATDTDTLEEGCRRIASFCSGLS